MKDVPEGGTKRWVQVFRALNGVSLKANISPFSCLEPQSMAFYNEEPEELPSQDGKFNRN